jgi:hypothetical protein
LQGELQLLSLVFVPTTSTHAPPLAVVHSLQSVVQEVAQQAPSSEQKPLAHCEGPLHAEPCTCLHEPAPLQV